MSLAGLFQVLLSLIMVALPLAAGVLLIAFSRRRGEDHPACGKCGYNVQASIGSGTRCPECGADFAVAGITPPSRRTRKPFMLGAGIVLIVVAMGCMGSSLLYQLRRAAPAPAPAPAPAAAARSPIAQPAPAPAPTAAPEPGAEPEAGAEPDSE